MSENQKQEQSPSMTRREFLKFATLVGAGSTLNAACNQLGRLPDTPTPYPTPEPTRDIENTPVPESVEPKKISAGGRIDIDPSNPSIEKLRFHFPEDVAEGDSPLIPKGDYLSVSFNLKSDSPITDLNISTSELFGITTANVSFLEDTSTIGAIDTSYLTDTLLQMTEHNKDTLIIDDKSRDIMNKIEVRYGILPDEDFLRMVLILPNEDFTFTDKEGGHIENPAKRFLSGELGVGIKRRGDIKPGTVIAGTIGLVAEDVNLYNASERKTVAEVDHNIDFNSVRKIVIKSGSTEPETKESESGNQREDSKWTSKEWEQNEKIPLTEWWNDMVSKGHIKVDSLAQQFAGDKIDDLVGSSHLVPNPHEYWSQGNPFIGDCKKSLDRLVRDSSGHISISSEAYSQIPGANNCQVFSNNK